jgi:histidinol-phosphate aminotransferase
MFTLDKLVRENIRKLKPYSSARHEFAGTAEIYLDANENAFGSPIDVQLNRYPDPLQTDVKRQIAELKGISSEQMFIGNGSDEAIDLLFRIFCEPGRDACIISPPTYGMYQVSADINRIAVNEVPLTEDFQLDVRAIKAALDEQTKLLFICSPNNPTGNAMSRDDVLELTDAFDGIVIVDEAYIDFSDQPSLTDDLDNHPNLVVLQTFSKAWGLAGARVGLAFASGEIIDLFSRVKPPYNVSQLSQTAICQAIANREQVAGWIVETLKERKRLAEYLPELDFVDTVYPSDANFLLVRVADANAVYNHLVEQRIVVRNRSSVVPSGDCLRITVGTPDENDRLICALKGCESSLTTAL